MSEWIRIELSEDDDPDTIIMKLNELVSAALVKWHNELIADKMRGKTSPDKQPVGIIRGDRMNEWISVEDMLPGLVHEVDDIGPVWAMPYVLTYDDESLCYDVGFYNPQYKEWMSSNGSYGLILSRVTMTVAEKTRTASPTGCRYLNRPITMHLPTATPLVVI